MPHPPDDSLTETLARAAPVLRTHYAAQIEDIKMRAGRRRVRRRLWAGAVVGAGCALAAWLPFGHYEVAAPPDRPLTVALGDGSTLALDAGASADLPLLPWGRAAHLRRGEAVFDIVHDESRPFVVTVGSATLTDRGTRFSVNAATLSVAVYDGVVEVAAPGTATVSLAAGQAGAVRDGAVRSVPLPDEAVATAWRQGRIVLRDTPLAEVAARLSRYRALPVELAEPAMAGWKVNGSFRIDDTDGALATLELAVPVEVRHRPDRTILLPRSAADSPPARKK